MSQEERCSFEAWQRLSWVCRENTKSERVIFRIVPKNRFSIVKYCSSPGNWIRVDSRAGREIDNACCSPEGKGVPQRLSKGVGREVQTGGNSYLCFCWEGSGEQSWRTNLEQGSLSSYRRASHRGREQLQGKFFAFFFFLAQDMLAHTSTDSTHLHLLVITQHSSLGIQF